MTKTIDVTGRTEDEAIESALEQLGLARDDVSVEIIERAKSGFLGLKSSPAIVRVIYEARDENTVRVECFLSGLFARMGVEAGVHITEAEESIDVVLTGADMGALIGRRGETLDAIQHLTNYVVNRGVSERVRINLDAENYRQRRNETLESLAARTAGKVVKYRRNMTLDPMNAYERHVIHSTLQNYDNITTYSVGVEPNRRIVVAYGRNNEGGGRSSEGGGRNSEGGGRSSEGSGRSSEGSGRSSEGSGRSSEGSGRSGSSQQYREWR